MQFAGQRTDMDLNPIAKPDNMLIKLTPDVLPQPGAVLVHGITPQKTLREGITETEFARYLTSQVSTPDTIILGYNNIRFDNEFIRFTLWRNFYDAYEWSWKEGCTVWDLLDVVRMARALRPEGIKWPFAPDGRPTNSLEYLSAVNNLDHVDAHDAMSDVNALVALARLLKQKQPELFDYLLNLRQKSRVAPLVTKGDPLIYTSGRYPSEFEKTTIAVMVAEKPDKSGALMYDLRIDPDEFENMPTEELAKRWRDRSDEASYFPVKELKYNRAPAIAPLEFLDDLAARRLSIHRGLIDNHLKKLSRAKGFGDKLLAALDMMWPKKQRELMIDELQVDGQLYDGFIKDQDKTKMSVVRAAKPNEISNLNLTFNDDRLAALLPLYKSRNFPEVLTDKEHHAWEDFRHRKLLGGNNSAGKLFFAQLNALLSTPGMDLEKKHLLEDLRAYGQSITTIA
jgi:exodeoxyribonuclease-1